MTVGSAVIESEGGPATRSRVRLCADDDVANTPIRSAATVPNRKVLRSIMLSPFIWRPGQLSRQSFDLRSRSFRPLETRDNKQIKEPIGAAFQTGWAFGDRPAVIKSKPM